MLLNLAMIKDKLPSSRILQSRVRKEHPRNLKQIRFYEKDQDLNPDILYLASAEDLPVTPETGQISLLCLGYLPAGYVNQDGYMEEEEKSVLYASKDFIDTFSVRGPTFSSMELYRTQIIYYNIFLQDNYLGRLIIENTYREFREGDYALAAWFGEYMRILMNRNRAFRFPASL